MYSRYNGSSLFSFFNSFLLQKPLEEWGNLRGLLKGEKSSPTCSYWIFQYKGKLKDRRLTPQKIVFKIWVSLKSKDSWVIIVSRLDSDGVIIKVCLFSKS